MSTDTAHQRRQHALTVATVLCVVAAVTLVPVGGALAQTQPGTPANFYGTITNSDDDLAPAGTEVYALVNGSVEDSLVIDEAGQYGGPGGFDEKLTINTGAGSEVTFAVGSPDGPTSLASPLSLENLESDPIEQNLTFETGTFVNVEELEFTLNRSTIAVNESAAPTITATYSNGTARDVTSQASLTSADPDVAAPTETTVSGVGTGETTLTATFDGVTAELLVTVTEASEPSGGSPQGGAGQSAPPAQPSFEIVTLDVPTQPVVGEPVTVSTTLTNTGEAPGTQTIRLRLAGEGVATQSLELASNATAEVTFTDIPTAELAAGEYTIRVSTVGATQQETLTLTSSGDTETGNDTDGDNTTSDESGESDDDDTGDSSDDSDESDSSADDTDESADESSDTDSTESTDDSTPGFGVLAALIGFLGLLLISRAPN